MVRVSNLIYLGDRGSAFLIDCGEWVAMAHWDGRQYLRWISLVVAYHCYLNWLTNMDQQIKNWLAKCRTQKYQNPLVKFVRILRFTWFGYNSGHIYFQITRSSICSVKPRKPTLTHKFAKQLGLIS